MSGWIGVDFDRTLAHYDHKQYPECGEPIAPMVERVKQWLAEGRDVRIVSARVCNKQGACERIDQENRIQEWCRRHIGTTLIVTAEKDFRMICLYDDRAVQVEPNTGEIIGREFDLNDLAS